MTYKAEYIWIDGTEPTPLLRSKTKILKDGAEPPIWGFDGSSTNQAEGHDSDRVLNPVFSCPDPIRGGDDILVMAEVLNTDMTPHDSNTRAACAAVSDKFASFEPLFGLDQFFERFIVASALRPHAGIGRAMALFDLAADAGGCEKADYLAWLQTVFVISRVTVYGSMLAFGRRSSM